MQELLNDLDFLEKFLEKYLQKEKNSLRGKVKIISITQNEAKLEVDEEEITIKIGTSK